MEAKLILATCSKVVYI